MITVLYFAAVASVLAVLLWAIYWCVCATSAIVGRLAPLLIPLVFGILILWAYLDAHREEGNPVTLEELQPPPPLPNWPKSPSRPTSEAQPREEKRGRTQSPQPQEQPLPADPPVPPAGETTKK